ncbi:hypothetical protein B0T20DRAFT_508449, partial [Sordaria brevicollis]
VPQGARSFFLVTSAFVARFLSFCSFPLLFFLLRRSHHHKDLKHTINGPVPPSILPLYLPTAASLRHITLRTKLDKAWEPTPLTKWTTAARTHTSAQSHYAVPSQGPQQEVRLSG